MNFFSFRRQVRNALLLGSCLALAASGAWASRGIWSAESKQEFLIAKGILHRFLSRPPAERSQKQIAKLERLINQWTQEYDLDESGNQRPLHGENSGGTTGAAQNPVTAEAPEAPVDAPEVTMRNELLQLLVENEREGYHHSHGYTSGLSDYMTNFSVAFYFAESPSSEGGLGLSPGAAEHFATRSTELDSTSMKNWIQKHTLAIQVANLRGYTIEAQLSLDSSGATYLVRDAEGKRFSLRITQNFKTTSYSLWPPQLEPMGYTLGIPTDIPAEAQCFGEHLRRLAETLRR